MERSVSKGKKKVDEYRKEVKKALKKEEPKVKRDSSWCWSILKFIILFLLIFVVFNYISLRQEHAKLRPSDGKLYDIGSGNNLFIYCKGHGKPVVVLDAPTGSTFDAWALIQEEVAKYTRVCSYDRSGLGFSDRVYRNTSTMTDSRQLIMHSTERMVNDLRHLLNEAKVAVNPIIYVGSEIGAANARYYASLNYPEVVHLILVNPLTEDFFTLNENVTARYWYGQLVPPIQIAQILSAIGFTRASFKLHLRKDPLENVNVDEWVKTRSKYLACSPGHQSTILEEYLLLNTSLAQLKKFLFDEPLPDTIPITVIASNTFDNGAPSELNKTWQKLISELVESKHPQSEKVEVRDADRYTIQYKASRIISKHIIQAIKTTRKTKITSS